MNETTLLALVFAVLLGLEWRYRLKSVRVGVAALALGVWLFTQPLPHRAARRVIHLPPAERVTKILDWDLPPYQSGVVTMEQAVVRDAAMFANDRLISVGVLFWLACSPVLRGPRSAPFHEAPEGQSQDELAKKEGSV